ncbi:hypothetical protein BpHYR1_001428 [Brachionus plicatilis]|uniref:HTH psq-type domain-containing protein n=1 Tax=Brachionus plicatilis TaxID=10195 RepID=A0A3M7PVL2_BRAPC|nr:hypothetical protein BpHYR1_001428 [Brachionus plicatilis]
MNNYKSPENISYLICFSLETIVEIIKKHCEQKIATSILAKEYSVNTSTISTILSFKEKILEHFEKNLWGTEKKRIKLSSLKKHFEKKNFFAHLFQCNFDITSNEISAQLAQRKRKGRGKEEERKEIDEVNDCERAILSLKSTVLLRYLEFTKFYVNYAFFAFKLLAALSQPSLNVDLFGINFKIICFPKSMIYIFLTFCNLSNSLGRYN